MGNLIDALNSSLHCLRQVDVDRYPAGVGNRTEFGEEVMRGKARI